MTTTSQPRRLIDALEAENRRLIAENRMLRDALLCSDVAHWRARAELAEEDCRVLHLANRSLAGEGRT